MSTDSTPAVTPAPSHARRVDLTNLTRVTIYSIYAQMILSAVSVISNAMEWRLLSDMGRGPFESMESMEAMILAAERNDSRQLVLAYTELAVLIVSGILILRWIYKANQNARELGARNMTFSPGWAVGWYFVPFANLWKPFQAMSELWRASADPDRWQKDGTPPLLGLWWMLWLATGFSANVGFRLSLKAVELDQLKTVNAWFQISNIASIALCVALLALITGIKRMQDEPKRTGLDHVPADTGEASTSQP